MNILSKPFAVPSLAAALTGTLLTSLAVRASENVPERPNIFFAIADDWGWPYTSAYGDSVVKTPVFDRVAQNGAIFNNAYVSSPSCTPSRNAMLTGQNFWRLGPGANLWSTLPEEHRTFTNILEDHGYFVGSYRKVWGPGTDRKRPVAGTVYTSFREFLNAKPAGEPFCFMFGSTDPHRGFEPGSGIASGMNPAMVKVPSTLPDTPEVRSDICDYFFEIERFDREVGEQLELLEQRGELDNTIVIMAGDNGWPFPRGKANLYDAGTRVPLAIQWNSEFRKKGREIDDFVSFTDFAPFLLEAAGIPPLKVMNGHSLLNLIRSTKSGRIEPERDHIVTGKERHTLSQAEGMGGAPARAIRTADFLYIKNLYPDRWPAGAPKNGLKQHYSDIDDGPSKVAVLSAENDPANRHFFDLSVAKRPADELYDLKSDPEQIKNVAGDPQYAKILTDLKERLFQELKETADPRISQGGEPFEQFPFLSPPPNTRK